MKYDSKPDLKYNAGLSADFHRVLTHQGGGKLLHLFMSAALPAGPVAAAVAAWD